MEVSEVGENMKRRWELLQTITVNYKCHSPHVPKPLFRLASSRDQMEAVLKCLLWSEPNSFSSPAPLEQMGHQFIGLKISQAH